MWAAKDGAPTVWRERETNRNGGLPGAPQEHGEKVAVHVQDRGDFRED